MTGSYELDNPLKRILHGRNNYSIAPCQRSRIENGRQDDIVQDIYFDPGLYNDLYIYRQGESCIWFYDREQYLYYDWILRS